MFVSAISLLECNLNFTGEETEAQRVESDFPEVPKSLDPAKQELLTKSVKQTWFLPQVSPVRGPGSYSEPIFQVQLPVPRLNP